MSIRYHEMRIHGPGGWALGFIQGFVRARGERLDLLDAEEEGFDCQPFGEQVGEFLKRSSETLHLLAPEEIVPVVRLAVGDAMNIGREVRILDERAIAGARFGFQFVVYARDQAKQIRRIFESLPKDVTLSDDTRFEETKDPGADELSAYAPAHKYELRAKGTVVGPVDGVLEMYRRCREHEPIQEGSAHLVPA